MNQTKPKFSYQTTPHASPTKLEKRTKIKEEALGTPSKIDLETHPRKRVREKSKQFAVLLIIKCWTLSLECSLK